MSTQVALLVYLDLDPVPGEMHTPESARDVIELVLKDLMPHYKPVVIMAPDHIEGNTNA